MTPQEFSTKIKAKYPQYASMDDVELAQRIVAKHPEYASQVTFTPTAKTPFPVAKPVIDAVKSYPSDVAGMFNQGAKDFAAGIDSAVKNPFDLTPHVLKAAGGIATGVGSIFAPVAKAISAPITAAADKISDIPTVQKFAAKPVGKAVSDTAEAFANAANFTGTFAGLASGTKAKVQRPIGPKGDTGNQGEVGPRGPAGPTGLRGPKGPIPTPTEGPVTAPFQVSARSLKTNPLKGTLPTPESVAAKGTDKILTKTRGIQNKVQEATRKNVDLQTYISDPDVYAGIKVENYKVNPDQAVSTIDNRIGVLLDAKREMLPTLDRFVPKTSREVVRKRAIESVKGKYSPLDELDVINSINKQVDALPIQMSLEELDNFRARFRQSARDAKGMQKRASEYAALENATRDTVFDATDSLPFAQQGDFAAVNKYIKDMIETKTFLDKTLRGQIVPGGRLGQIAARGIGAAVGSSHGPFATLLGAEVGGMVQNIIANNALGSSVKFQLIKGITKDPAILAQAQQMLSAAKDYAPPMLPAPRTGAPRTTTYGNNPIPMTADSTLLDQGAIDARYGQSLSPNISRQNTANMTMPSKPSPSMMPSILPRKSDAAPLSPIPTTPVDAATTKAISKKTGGVPSPTTASKPSKAANTSTGNVPTGRGGVSAQKADTSGGFNAMSPELRTSIETAQNAIRIQKQVRIPSAQQDQIIYQDGNKLSVVDRDAYEGTKDYSGALLPPPEKIRGPVQAIVKTDGTIEYPLNTQATIPKDLEPLAAEARKYKSAEEFVRAAKTLPVTKWGVSEEVLSSVLFKDIKPGDGTAGVENVLTDLWHKATGK